MDIEPFWAFGGWFLYSSINYMADQETKITSPSSVFCLSSYTTKSHPLVLFLFLLVILLLLVHPAHQIRPSSSSASMTTMVSTTQTSTLPLDSSSSSTTFHPKKGRKPTISSSDRKRFESSDHEVPSGPNPISN